MKDPDEDDELPDDFEEATLNLSPEDLQRTLQETFLEMHATALLGKGTPLRFPMEVGERVMAYQKEHAIVLDELIPRAVAAQIERVDEVVKSTHRLRKDPGSFEWPIEDPLLCVAIAFIRESMDWWLNKINEEDSDEDSSDDDQADDWKADEPE
jgi:hypothetical protein